MPQASHKMVDCRDQIDHVTSNTPFTVGIGKLPANFQTSLLRTTSYRQVVMADGQGGSADANPMGAVVQQLPVGGMLAALSVTMAANLCAHHLSISLMIRAASKGHNYHT